MECRGGITLGAGGAINESTGFTAPAPPRPPPNRRIASGTPLIRTFKTGMTYCSLCCASFQHSLLVV